MIDDRPDDDFETASAPTVENEEAADTLISVIMLPLIIAIVLIGGYFLYNKFLAHSGAQSNFSAFKSISK